MEALMAADATPTSTIPAVPPHGLPAAEVVARLNSDAATGISESEAQSRLATSGRERDHRGEAPLPVQNRARPMRDPMNLMLVAVTVVSVLIDQVSTAIFVGLLILLNITLGTRQELTARASVDALSKMQVPQARVVRGGGVALVPAAEVVPGDIVEVEAGDIVPADGRIIRSATLEVQEAALTGESAPVSKDAKTLDSVDVQVGDRTNMLFQNTSVTRGTATMVVTATGMDTQMGQIATMLTSVPHAVPAAARARLAHQGVGRDRVDRRGRHRGGRSASWHAGKELLLLGTAMAVSAIPTGMPAFVSGLLSLGARQLADAKAVVKNLTDVETLGATSAINTDKTGTLTLNEMMVSTLYADGSWFNVEGGGVSQDRIDHGGGRCTGPRLHQACLGARPGYRRGRR